MWSWTSWDQFKAGARAGGPVVLGFLPVALAYAVMARQTGLSHTETCAMSLLVYAGASQMMALAMVQQGASAAAIVVATFFLNLRHLIMSACVFHRLRDSSVKAKALAAFGVTDESFALFTAAPERCGMAFFLGIFVVTYLAWSLGTWAGAMASGALPEAVADSFGIALYGLFIALLVPGLRGHSRLTALAVATGLCNWLLCQVMASSWAMIVSTLVCALAGVAWVDLPEESKEVDHD